jgi:hypothetical protein
MIKENNIKKHVNIDSGRHAKNIKENINDNGNEYNKHANIDS